MLAGAFRSAILVSCLLFIPFVSGKDCADKSSGCPDWASAGDCKNEWKTWMANNCEKSCNLCESSGSGGSSGSDFAASCKNDYAACQLAKHNELRQKHGSPAMTLNAQMNQEAQAWAQENANNHRMKHADRKDINGNGENLWYGCGYDPAQATQDWYDEMTNPGYDFNNPGWNANPGTGHFTQVVWKASTEFGIGKAVADDGCVYVCARYSPGGNMMGDFEANVKKPNN